MIKLFQSKDGRTLERGMLVGVHWNSHKNKYSVVAFPSRHTVGLVVGYVDSITLKDCTFHIDKTKQRIVREKGTKERHAFVVGIVDGIGEDRTDCMHQIVYNPFKYDTFHGKHKNCDKIWLIEKAKHVHMDNVDNARPLVTFDSVQ